jgi:hypothetical protein
MKIRTHFVSNSSSSSFIILWRSEDFVPCPHCGLGPTRPDHLFAGRDSYSSSYSSVDFDDFNSYLDTFTEETARQDEHLKKLLVDDPKRAIWDGYTVADEIKSTKRIIGERKDFIAALEALMADRDGFLAVSLDHNDKHANEVIDGLKAAGKIKVLDDIF